MDITSTITIILMVLTALVLGFSIATYFTLTQKEFVESCADITDDEIRLYAKTNGLKPDDEILKFHIARERYNERLLRAK